MSSGYAEIGQKEDETNEIPTYLEMSHFENYSAGKSKNYDYIRVLE